VGDDDKGFTKHLESIQSTVDIYILSSREQVYPFWYVLVFSNLRGGS
jgi:hypothetical protein